MSVEDARDRLRATKTGADGLPCSACGEPVDPPDELYIAVMRGLPYGFHASCYGVWLKSVEPDVA